MKTRLTWLGRRPAGRVGLEATPAGVALAHMLPPGAAGAGCARRLRSCDYISAGDDQARAALLGERVDALGLAAAACNIVLPPQSYQLLLVEAPAVPGAELRDALRWRVKDLIDWPLDDVVVDVLPLPQRSSRDGGNTVYAVAALRRDIAANIDLAEGAGLRVGSVDIGEMALRNLAQVCADDSRGIALVKLNQGCGNLALVRDGSLYLSRRFDLDYNAGLLDDIPAESLVLELQRSLDYYERQMGQVPPATVLLAGENLAADKITDTMRAGLSAQVRILELERYLDCENPVDDTVLQACTVAIGGALRREAA